jgi:ketosteroid isomerase-like protein
MNEREAIDAAVAAWNEGGVDAFLKFLAPDVEWHAPPEFPGGEIWHDRESLAPVMRDQFGPGGVFSTFSMELLEAQPAPHGWLIESRQRAGHASGMDLDWRTWFVAQIENAQVKRIWVFMDREPAERKAGL